ncbi:MAG: hypothetical protein IKE10_00980 [Bacilli bacterium]|nr:hypothetical protein [Bacilli bacterium]
MKERIISPEEIDSGKIFDEIREKGKFEALIGPMSDVSKATSVLSIVSQIGNAREPGVDCELEVIEKDGLNFLQASLKKSKLYDNFPHDDFGGKGGK